MKKIMIIILLVQGSVTMAAMSGPKCQILEKTVKKELEQTKTFLGAYKNMSFKLANRVSAIFGHDILTKFDERREEMKKQCHQELRDFIDRQMKILENDIDRIIIESEFIKLEQNIERISTMEREELLYESDRPMMTFEVDYDGGAVSE